MAIPNKGDFLETLPEEQYNAGLIKFNIPDSGILSWGDELVLQCHGGNRPTLDPEWIKSNILNQ